MKRSKRCLMSWTCRHDDHALNFSREHASKVRVLTALASGDYDLIHFACHARPGALCLADGWLTTTEIQAALRGSPFIFLNACSSARDSSLTSTNLPFVGQQSANLAEAFLTGGATAFIGTLWPVADASIGQLAVDFYRSLLNGKPVGKALRQARSHSINTAPNEISWAAPVLYGDPCLRLVHTGHVRQVGTILLIRLPFPSTFWQAALTDELTQQRQDEINQITTILSTYGGEIITLSAEEIHVAFGVPHPFEDDAVRAINAALAIQQVTANWNTGQVAMTIASGEIVVSAVPWRSSASGLDTSDLPLYLGSTLVEARLLAEQIRPGQVLATEATRKLVNDLFRFVPVVEAPIQGYEVTALPSVGVFQTPHPTPQRNRTTFLGRESELATLTAYWQTTRQGRGQVVGIIGEAGIGKTRLLHEFRQNLPADEYNWLAASCPPTGRDTPYSLINQLLRQLFNIALDETEATVTTKIEQHLRELPGIQAVVDAQLIQILKETLGFATVEFPFVEKEEREARRGRLVYLLRNMMANAAKQTPLLITLDDMHWVDEASLEILDQVTDGVGRLPVQFMVFSRPEWQHRWFQKPYYRHLSLDHLSDTACINLLCHLLGIDELPKGLAPLLEKTGGNPFFLEEMLKTLQETGVLARATSGSGASSSGGWELRQPLTDAQLPATVQRTLGVRFDRLPPETRQVLQAAAVVGPVFALPLLHTILGDLERPLDQHLADLEDRNFFYARWDAGDYKFRHALVQDAAYQSLPTAHRQLFHRRLAEALATDQTSTLVTVEMLAHHFYHSLLVSRPGEAPRLDASASQDQIGKANTYLIQSGKRAQSRYAAREAITYYQRVLDVNQTQWSDSDLEVEIREGLGDAYNILGDFEAAYKELRKAYAALHTRPLDKADRRRAADLARRIGRLCMWQGQHETALHWMGEGLRQLGSPEDAEDQAVAALLRIHSGSVEYNRGNLKQAEEECTRGLELTNGDLHSSTWAEGYNLLGIIRWAHGANQDALDHLQQSQRSWQDLGNIYQEHRVGGNIGVVHYHLGAWVTAQTYHTKNLGYWEQIEDQDMLAHTCLNSGNIYLYQGNWEAAAQNFERALGIWQKTENQRWIGLCRNNLGFLYIEQELYQQAQEHFEQAQRLFLQWNIRDLLPENYCGLAEVALSTNQPKLALKLAKQAYDIAEELGMRAEQASALRTLGRGHAIIGIPGIAIDKLMASLELLRGLDTQYELARTLHYLAICEFQSTHRKEGQRHIEEAIAIFQRLGAMQNYKRSVLIQSGFDSGT
ncbi:MAG: AAA family ATPase [Caldilineaceae bacterium]